jgi:hypothetical protein
MMSLSRGQKALVIASVHVLIVLSIGGKLLLDRATRPRVWARTAPFDPFLPIRGRYVRLRLEAEPKRMERYSGPVELSVEGGNLVAQPSAKSSNIYASSVQMNGRPVAMLSQPVAYFITEGVADPSRRKPGEELWVEVTVPRTGPPRPIRLGIKTGSGEIVPLDLK